jgi:hypothetical protein
MVVVHDESSVRSRLMNSPHGNEESDLLEEQNVGWEYRLSTGRNSYECCRPFSQQTQPMLTLCQ